MSRIILFCLTVLIIENASAQLRTSNVQPKTIPALQKQNIEKLWNFGPLPSPSSPRMKLISQRHQYVIKKTPQKKIAKRQLLAELLKQSAMKNLQEAATICDREKKSTNLNHFFGNIRSTANDVANLNDRYHLKYV